MNKYKDPTEITIDRNGLAWRGGKILGRKPWIVATESSITLRDEMVVKAATRNRERVTKALKRGQKTIVVAAHRGEGEDPLVK